MRSFTVVSVASLVLLGCLGCSGGSPPPIATTTAAPEPAITVAPGTPPACEAHDVRTESGRSACNAAGCVVLSGAPVDEAAHCTNPGEPLACTTEQPCDDALTTARSPAGTLFLFADSCTPAGWLVVEGGADLAECTTAALGPPARELALASYRSALAAYNDGDQERYYASFAETLSCFHGAPDVPLARVREGRAPDFAASRWTHAHRVEVVAELEAGILLLDRGADFVELDESAAAASRHASDRTSASPIRSATHEKLVLMAPLARGGFRIVAETSARDPGCVSAPARIAPSPEHEACSAAARRCTAECDGRCAAPTPGNSCNECPASCARELARCVSATVPFLE
jgi:hypothetical protein